MDEATCDYLARKSEPERWHGEDPNEWGLDNESGPLGLGIEEWRCPHPPLEAGKYCVFHTDPEDVPDDVDESKELLGALEETGKTPFDDGPEHRGQFVGATFGAVDFSNETIAADDHDVRFDHALFQGKGDTLHFEETEFVARGEQPVSFYRATFRTDGDGDVILTKADIGGADLRFAYLIGATLKGATLTNVDLREATLSDVSVDGATTCERLHERPEFEPEDWDATARAYHNLKSVFSDHGLIGKARRQHVGERRARGRETRASSGRFNRRYPGFLISKYFTGYGVRVQTLMTWMLLLFVGSTAWYAAVGVELRLISNVSYSVLAFTVAPPKVPPGLFTQFVVMVETFFGTLSIVLLGYVLGNREQF